MARKVPLRDAFLVTSGIGLELLEDYREGGYHPVHLGDRFGDGGRYTVLHKLGHGEFSTVWLCRDQQASQYIALKIHMADACEEHIALLKIAGLERSAPGWEYIAMPIDHFSIAGPNGTHQCLVLPLLGSHVSPRLCESLRQGQDGCLIRIHIALQAIQAMSFLHTHQVCHGDFRPRNILLHIEGFHDLTKNQLFSLVNPPSLCEVRTRPGKRHPQSVPRYLVDEASLWRLSSRYVSGKVNIIDFGDACHFQSPDELIGIPECYLPPEELLQLNKLDDTGCWDISEDEDTIDVEPKPPVPINGPTSDMWALGCTLFEIVAQRPLFYINSDRNELLADLARRFGKFPDEMWNQWKDRPDWFNDQGMWLGRRDSDRATLERWLEPTSTVDTRKKGLSKEMQTAFGHLLRRVLAYRPEERGTADKLFPWELLMMLDPSKTDPGLDGTGIWPSTSELSFKELLK